MKRKSLSILAVALAACSVGLTSLTFGVQAPADQPTAAGGSTQPAAPAGNLPSSAEEARSRARILHEMIHGTLQVMHRDFFDDENPFAIPSQSLEDVFHELARGYDVRLRWLTVNTDVLNVDHKPQNEFEENAVKALRAGKDEFDATEKDSYRYAGAIRLSSQCLKCHVKRRTSTEERVAGLLVTMSLKK